MIELIKKEYKQILILCFVLIVSFAVFWLKQANVFVDIGREFYIPSQMNKGLVLYKDILNVYSPLSYQFNALLYKIFGEKISTLYNFGVFNASLIIFGVYFLAREFLSKYSSLVISVLMIGIYIIYASSFNYVFPYTYSMPYAISSFLFSVFFLIKYIKKPEAKYFYIAAFLGGMSLDFKLEYILYPFMLLYVALFLQPLKKIEFFNSILCFILMPVFSLLLLFMQGVRFIDLANAFEIMQKMTNVPSVQYFYKNYSGFIFNFPVMVNTLKYFVIGIIMFLALSIRNNSSTSVNNPSKRLVDILSVIIIYLILAFTYKNILLPLSLINLGLFLFHIKKIYNNKPLFIMSICAMIAAFKSVFVFAVNTYGIFAAPFLFISFMALFLYVFDEEKESNKLIESIKYNLNLVLIVLIFMLFYVNYQFNKDKVKLVTPKGNICVAPGVAYMHQTLIDFINKNTQKTDRVVILPETPLLNFITDRTTHNFYMCLIPVYLDVFGEQKIISDFEKDKPEYFILNNRNCIEYGAAYFGLDFAEDLKKFIDKNYVLIRGVKTPDNTMLVYERKDIRWKKLH